MFVCLFVGFFLLNSFSFFAQTLIPLLWQLFLFCLLVYFVHLIPHISKIIWYLSFSDWLISLSIILSRSIHAVTKDKISFYFRAE